jgi:hypothetical protein
MARFLKILPLIFVLSVSSATAQEIYGTPRNYDIETGREIQELNVNDVCFFYALNSRQDTIKVWTVDPKFQTPEKYKVGTKLKDIPKKLQKDIIKIPGLGYELRLNSCWNLYFCEGDACTEEALKPTSEVTWIRRRNF